MKDDIKSLIDAARSAYPNMKTVQRLCDELEKSAQFNDDTLAIKIKLQEGNKCLTEENQRLIADKDNLEAIVEGVLTAAGEDWQDVDELPNTIAKMRHELELKSASGYPVNASQHLIEQLIEQTQKLLNPPQAGIPPMSPECFRQHAVLAALNGMIASGKWNDLNETVLDAVITADAMVKELAK